ncbi:MAG: glycoside hydrolase, partial [Verrucomicrobiota bacterium]|nr:glycoside hydrolase [Verrucomicrobiota bacterium]
SFPYRLSSGQQESGSVSIASRGRDGAITFRDWHPVGAEEYGYVVADPIDPEIVYGGKLSRYDRRTGQAQSITPVPLPSPDFRMVRTAPIVFSLLDPHLLFFAGNTLWKTRDGGQHWQQISPDLSRKTYDLPASIGKFRQEPTAEAKQRGVIYTVAPSPLEVDRIWAGTDDGLIHLTTDGGQHWTDVTPPQLSAWQKVSIIDAGHFNAQTAYAAVNTLRLDDLRPHIYRTTDSGKTWREIVRGIPDGQTVNVVREDPQRPGLLFAGTERAVYVSFDDGENWQSLRFNMPATSVRDLIVKDDDLAVATHGRGFWILDNLTPLRQLVRAKAETVLLKPQTAMRVRWNTNSDTPLPPDEPVGENPPDGAMLDYYLNEDASGPVTLEIKDAKGEIVRRFASTDAVPSLDPVETKIPLYWIRPARALSAARGLHRFLWDLHGAPIPEVAAEYPMTAIYRDTPTRATSPWVLPGEYSVTLTVAGQTQTRPLTVKMDPRVQTSPEGLAEQFALSKRLYERRLVLEPLGRKFDDLVAQTKEAQARAGQKPIRAKVEAFVKKLQEFAPPNARPGAPLSFGILDLVQGLFEELQQADVAPTPGMPAAVTETERAADSAMERWRGLLARDLPALNQELELAGMKKIELPAATTR